LGLGRVRPRRRRLDHRRAELTGCGHSVGGGGPGSAGAGHIRIDATAAHIEVAGPDDPNPGGHVFYIDHNVVTFIGHGGSQTVVDDPDFLGDTQMRVEPGHYSFHPLPASRTRSRSRSAPPGSRTRRQPPAPARAAVARPAEEQQ
jgi:hypothetical protein